MSEISAEIVRAAAGDIDRICRRNHFRIGFAFTDGECASVLPAGFLARFVIAHLDEICRFVDAIGECRRGRCEGQAKAVMKNAVIYVEVALYGRFENRFAERVMRFFREVLLHFFADFGHLRFLCGVVAHL